MKKDIRLARQTGDDLQLPLPSATVADEILTKARNLGYAHRDPASGHNVLAEHSRPKAWSASQSRHAASWTGL